MNGRAPGALRIAQIAPVATAVEPEAREPVPGVVSRLTEGLVTRGHIVTLFATADSRTSAELSALYDQGYEEEGDDWEWPLIESLNVASACARASEFDVVHSHNGPYAVPFAPFVDVPTVHTLHGDVGPAAIDAYDHFAGIHLVAVSQFQSRRFPGRPNIEHIPPGVDIDALPFSSAPGDHLLFWGPMTATSGPREAVEIARAAGMALTMAGPAEEGFEHEIAPLLDPGRVSYVGSPDPVQRRALMADAGALVCPVAFPEPFTLMLIEALGCGTPVLGIDAGSLPEILEAGVTGYVSVSRDELAERAADALALDREAIRVRTRERFGVERMLDGHEELYLRLVHEQPATRVG